MAADRERGLGRLPAADDRDGLHPMRAILPRTVEPVTRYWRTGPVLDQGSSSSCVGHAWRQFLASSPTRTKAGPDAFEIYGEAQRVDEWEGEEPAYFGTSVRAGVKVLEARGHIVEYVWGLSARDVIDHIVTRGPVVLGTDWREAMFTPDGRGFVRIEGELAGGHAYLAYGYSVRRQAIRCVNSWGAGWGQRGRFWIAEDDIERLLRADGEACSAIERAA